MPWLIAIGVLIVGLFAVSASASSGNPLAGETWKAHWVISPALDMSQAMLDNLETQFKGAFSSVSVTYNDIQFTPTGADVTVTFNVAPPQVPPIGFSMTMSGHTMRLASFTKVSYRDLGMITP
jgi:hypothetical protein